MSCQGSVGEGNGKVSPFSRDGAQGWQGSPTTFAVRTPRGVGRVRVGSITHGGTKTAHGIPIPISLEGGLCPHRHAAFGMSTSIS
jgi:hypothetical protein